MTAITTAYATQFATGTRVVFPEGAEAYPHFQFNNERLFGTVVEIDAPTCADRFMWVRLDVLKSELTEWENQIQVFIDDEIADETTNTAIRPIAADATYAQAAGKPADAVEAAAAPTYAQTVTPAQATTARAENTYKANDADFLLDAFIQGWCKAMRVEPDGDVFSHLFGEQDEFTESEADTILRAWRNSPQQPAASPFY